MARSSANPLNGGSEHGTQPSDIRLPDNVRMAAMMMDAQHVALVPELIRKTQSEQAIALLAAWERGVDRCPFLVMAGELHKTNGGIIGGLASTWGEARLLFDLAKWRLDGLAEQFGGYSSAWLLLLDTERVQEVQALMAEAQATAGRA